MSKRHVFFLAGLIHFLLLSTTGSTTIGQRRRCSRLDNQCDGAVTDALSVHQNESLQAFAVKLALHPAADVSCCEVRTFNYFDHLKAPVGPPTAISTCLTGQQNPDIHLVPPANFQAALTATPFQEFIL